MRHFPIFLDTRDEVVSVVGGGEIAVFKLRLLLKTEARIVVHADDPCDEIRQWHGAGRLIWKPRAFSHEDAARSRLVYAATGDAETDADVRRIAEPAGALVNVVDNLEATAFLTPAIVDRDPVTVAIGTEGTAPVLARQIKAEMEERLPPLLGVLARAASGFRARAEELPAGRKRRAFWTRFFRGEGERAFADGGEAAVHARLESLFEDAQDQAPNVGRVVLVGAGPGDPELLTLKARQALHEADVVIHDRLVAPEILELARREAHRLEVGKTPGGPAWSQDAINAEMIQHARAGAVVVRLKAGDPLVFGRADEELAALSAAGTETAIIPGITAATAAAAAAGVSLTRRGRNASIALITAHDAKGFAEHDWRSLARADAAFAVYMGVRASRFLQGRLLLHGAARETPVTVVENASRPDQRIVTGTLGSLDQMMQSGGIKGPAIIFVGVPAADAVKAASEPVVESAVGAGGGA